MTHQRLPQRLRRVPLKAPPVEGALMLLGAAIALAACSYRSEAPAADAKPVHGASVETVR